jgi:hypothetical protein
MAGWLERVSITYEKQDEALQWNIEMVHINKKLTFELDELYTAEFQSQ